MHNTTHRPVMRYIFEGAETKPTFEAIMVGKHLDTERDINWSFLGLDNHALRACVAQVAEQMGAQKVWAPVPNFSAKIIDTQHLSREVLVGETTLWRNEADAPGADGVQLLPDEAYAATGGGCPFIVGICEDRMAVAHAGKFCLLDPHHVHNVGKPRAYTSVVDSLVGQLARPGFDYRRAIQVWVFGSVRPEDYPHHVEGAHAKKPTSCANMCSASGTTACPPQTVRCMSICPS
jgi:hypothetical protein